MYEFFGKKISGRFTIPSGIITVTLDVLQKIAEEIPQIGILTTKSIGPCVREGNPEPVFAQINKEKFTNAVGLANPGCEEFAKELSCLALPKDKFLLVSIFGSSPDEMQLVAKTLEQYADGLELNMSCPHAEGLGQAICASPEIAAKYVRAVKEVTKKPVLAKLSPNIGDLKPVVRALIDAGADGFTAINTVGPEEFREPISNEIVLSHKKGGISGPVVRNSGTEKVRQISEAASSCNKKILVIGMGGISCHEDVESYEKAGADFFGIGTALAGMSLNEIKYFFSRIEEPGCRCSKITDDMMKFREFRVEKVESLADDLVMLHLDRNISSSPGQFHFIWLPGSEEKPFSPAKIEPACFVIRIIGPFTKKLAALKQGSTVMIRGPYGNGFTVTGKKELNYCIVGGGTGIAPLLHLASSLSKKGVPKTNIHVFLGGRTKHHVYFIDDFLKLASIHISTDDGSMGAKGFVTQIFEEYLNQHSSQKNYVYICGPEKMMKRAFDMAKAYPHEEIECSIERYMKCGVGICGICSMDGLRTCVDGNIFNEKFLAKSKCFGISRRKKTGEIERI